MGGKKDAKTKSKQPKSKEIAAPDLPDETQSKFSLSATGDSMDNFISGSHRTRKNSSSFRFDVIHNKVLQTNVTRL